jgi:uncharacterized membrane protein YkoI
MKRTSILVAAIGAAVVLGAGGTALAATTDDSPATATPRATDDDFGLRGDGTVDDSAPSPSPSPSSTSRSGFGGAVSATDAEARALAATGGGRVIRVEAETEHGNAVWSVRIVMNGVRYDLDVDRGIGAVRAHGHGADDNVAGDRHGGRSGSDDGSRHAVTTAGDDRGGERSGSASHVEAGDDKGGERAGSATRVEAGDDKGGRQAEAGDDRGGHGGEPGDDHGRH